MGLFLQGIKAAVNYLFTRSEAFNETFLSRSNEMEYVNLLSVPVLPKNQVDKINTPAVNESHSQDLSNPGARPMGKEVFMPTSFHQSAWNFPENLISGKPLFDYSVIFENKD